MKNGSKENQAPCFPLGTRRYPENLHLQRSYSVGFPRHLHPHHSMLDFHSGIPLDLGLPWKLSSQGFLLPVTDVTTKPGPRDCHCSLLWLPETMPRCNHVTSSQPPYGSEVLGDTPLICAPATQLAYCSLPSWREFIKIGGRHKSGSYWRGR